jgi:hypothetical protein
MSRTCLPFAVGDLSQFARSLKRELAACEHKPGHVEILNMLARSAGYRNFQHFRSDSAARERIAGGRLRPSRWDAGPVDHRRIERVVRHFDEDGLLLRWPAKASLQLLCLWVLWSRIPSRRVLTEPQINQLLQANHVFGDHALLRRSLYDHQLVSRTKDCSEYRRIEHHPPPEALAVIRYLARRGAD